MIKLTIEAFIAICMGCIAVGVSIGTIMAIIVRK